MDRITHDLNAGHSWGLHYAKIYGWRPERGTWCVWDRHTGEVFFEEEPDKEDFVGAIDFAERRAKEFSMPKNYSKQATTEDSVS